MTHWVSFVRGNPLRYTDPSGNSVCDLGKYADPECNGLKINRRPQPPKPPVVETTTPTLQPSPTLPSITGSGNACSGSNWSVVCIDPTLVSRGQVQTNVVYPIHQTPSNYDGPYAEAACVHLLLCLLGLGADAAHWGNYQTCTASLLQGSYVTANVNYEVHNNIVGYYTAVTSLDITNTTDATLSLRDVVINEKYEFDPTAPIRVDPGQSLTVSFQPYAIPGKSGSVNLSFTSTLYLMIVLTANYP